jgi:tetratricopeptide (TPR) repeat protein
MTVLASQARANILVFLAVYPLFTAWRWWHTRQRAALLPMLGLAGALGMMIPWGILNLRQVDHFHLVTNAGGVNFYFGNRRGADGMFGHDVVTALSELSRSNAIAPTATANQRYEDLVEVWAREEYAAAMRAQNRSPENDPKAVSQYWTQRTIDEVKADPTAWLKLVARKCWLSLWNQEVPNNKDFRFLQQEYWWLRVMPVRWVVLLMLAPAGLWAATRFRNLDSLFILLVYAGIYSAGNVAFFICDRYRYPVWPALAVLAGGGLLAGIEMIRQRNRRGLGCVLVCAGLMAAVSLPNWFGAKLPNFAQDYFFRSAASYDKGRLAEELADINRSVELDPLNAGPHQHRGNVLFALNQLDEACRAYEQALRLIPGNSGVWNNLGASLEALGKMDAALRAYREAIGCQPPSPLAFLGLAFIQIRAGQLADASGTLDQLEKLQRAPTAATLAARSVIERQHGDQQHAASLEEQARQMDPSATAWAIERATKSPAQKRN